MEDQRNISPMENSICKMSTSESEQSLSDKCVSRSSNPPNRSVFFFEHISDEDNIHEDCSDNGSINYCQISDRDGFSDIHAVHDQLDLELLEDSENHNVSYERSNYFTLAYTSDDIENITSNTKMIGEKDQGGQHLASELNSSFLTDEENSDLDETLVCNKPEISSKKSSMKLFSPEKVMNAMTRIRMANSEIEEKVSPMDMSSPDSNKSFAEEVTKSLGTFSLSEDSQTYVVDSNKRKGKLDDDSLDEISSGEMSSASLGNSSHISQNVSEYWDEERYLSEYNYDEPIDEDKARKLLNFGDDYRNFIDSLSESQSGVSTAFVDSKKRSKRLSKKKMPDSGRFYDTCSDNDFDDVSSVLADSQREINSVETKKSNWEEDGFVKEEFYSEYSDLMEICSDNLKIIIDFLRTKDLQETFVSKKKSREMRFLLNKWERLHNKIKENIQHTGIYETLKKDVLSFKRDLTNVLERTEEQDNSEDDGELEHRLHTFRDAMLELSDFKSHLFELNLSVHNFLAEVNTSSQLNNKAKFERAVHLKDDVIELYTLWDKAHHQTAGSIASTEEALKKLKSFENELLELRDTLRRDAKVIKEKGSRKPKRVGSKGKNSSGDSGISDDSAGYFTDSDIPMREEHLTKLRLMAKSLEQNLPAGSTPMLLINHTLETTSDELKDLQKSYNKFKALKRKPKSINNVQVKASEQKMTSYQTLRRRQVVKMALLMNLLLLVTAVLCWVCQPSCCESHNTMAFQPQLKYVNGPPPI